MQPDFPTTPYGDPFPFFEIQGEPEVLRDVFVLPDRHHWLLRPHVPRPVHRGPRPRHPHRRLRGEARGVPRHPEQSHPG